jgi:hydrogenase maturation protease
MTRADGPVLVLGIGNVLLGDEGAGVHVVRALGRLIDRGDVEVPPGTRLLDGGTVGLGLLPMVWDSRAVLLVDAMDGGRAPGSIEAIRGDALREVSAAGLPARGFGVSDLLSAAWLAGALPAAVALVGIQSGEVAIGLELTPAVQAAVPAAVATTLAELRRLDAIAPSAGPGSVADSRGCSTRGCGE